MSFDVLFTDDVPYGLSAPKLEAKGVVVIGNFEETFYSALDRLSKLDYLWQWRYAVQRIIEGCGHSAVVTSFADRGGEIAGMWWPMYAMDGGLVVVQSHLILRQAIDEHFSLQTCYDYLGPHRSITEEDEPVSEWPVDWSELAAFSCRVQQRVANHSIL